MVDFLDGEHRAALVLGHRLDLSCSVPQLQKLNDTIKALAASLDAPLALVSPVHLEDHLDGEAVVGLVLAHARYEQRPTIVDKARAVSASPAELPAALKDALQGLEPGIEASGEVGLFLCPGGWSSASLEIGTIEDEEDWEPGEDEEWEGEVEGDEVAICSSEDTAPIVLLADLQQQLDDADSDADLILSAEYC